MTPGGATMTRPATVRTPGHVDVLQAHADDIRRGDQVAFVAAAGEHSDEVAGGVTGVRREPGSATLALVVDNHVHFVPHDHPVIIMRGCTPEDSVRQPIQLV